MAKSYYKKYYESHREQEKKRTNAYYHEHRDEILARNKEKRDGMPKTKKPTLREKLLLTETAYKMACDWIDSAFWTDNDCDTLSTVEYFMQKAKEMLKDVKD